MIITSFQVTLLHDINHITRRKIPYLDDSANPVNRLDASSLRYCWRVAQRNRDGDGDPSAVASSLGSVRRNLRTSMFPFPRPHHRYSPGVTISILQLPDFCACPGESRAADGDRFRPVTLNTTLTSTTTGYLLRQRGRRKRSLRMAWTGRMERHCRGYAACGAQNRYRLARLHN